jgi:hypothetical protein
MILVILFTGLLTAFFICIVGLYSEPLQARPHTSDLPSGRGGSKTSNNGAENGHKAFSTENYSSHGIANGIALSPPSGTSASANNINSLIAANRNAGNSNTTAMPGGLSSTRSNLSLTNGYGRVGSAHSQAHSASPPRVLSSAGGLRGSNRSNTASSTTPSNLSAYYADYGVGAPNGTHTTPATGTYTQSPYAATGATSGHNNRSVSTGKISRPSSSSLLARRR